MKTYRQKSRAGATSSNGGGTPQQVTIKKVKNLAIMEKFHTRDLMRRKLRQFWTVLGIPWTWPQDRGSMGDHLLAGKELHLGMAVRLARREKLFFERNSPCLQVFCGKIPKDMYEDELIPHFEKCGRIWDLRLMMDPMSGLNRLFED